MILKVYVIDSNGFCVLQLNPQGLCLRSSLCFLSTPNGSYQFQMGVYVSGFLWACIFHTSMSRSMLAILDGPTVPKTI